MALDEEKVAPYTGIDGSTSYTKLDDLTESDNPPETLDVKPNLNSSDAPEDNGYDKYLPGWKGTGKGVMDTQTKQDASTPGKTDNKNFDKFVSEPKEKGKGGADNKTKPSISIPDDSDNSDFDKYTPGWKGNSKWNTTSDSGKKDESQREYKGHDKLNFGKNPDAPKGETDKETTNDPKPANDKKPGSDKKPGYGGGSGGNSGKAQDKNKIEGKKAEDNTQKDKEEKKGDNKPADQSKCQKDKQESKGSDKPEGKRADNCQKQKIDPPKIQEPTEPAPTTVDSGHAPSPIKPATDCAPQETIEPPAYCEDIEPYEPPLPAPAEPQEGVCDASATPEGASKDGASPDGKSGDNEKGILDTVKEVGSTIFKSQEDSWGYFFDDFQGYAMTGVEADRDFFGNSHDYEAIKNKMAAACDSIDQSMFPQKLKYHQIQSDEICTENAIVKCAMGTVFSRVHLLAEPRPFIGTAIKNRILYTTDFVPGANFDGFGPCWNILNPAVAAATLAASLAAGTFVLTPFACQATMMPSPWIPMQQSTIGTKGAPFPQMVVTKKCISMCWGLGAIEFVHCGQGQGCSAPGFGNGEGDWDGHAVASAALNIAGLAAGAFSAGARFVAAKNAIVAARAAQAANAAMAAQRVGMVAKIMQTMKNARTIAVQARAIAVANKVSHAAKVAEASNNLGRAGKVAKFMGTNPAVFKVGTTTEKVVTSIELGSDVLSLGEAGFYLKDGKYTDAALTGIPVVGGRAVGGTVEALDFDAKNLPLIGKKIEARRERIRKEAYNSLPEELRPQFNKYMDDNKMSVKEALMTLERDNPDLITDYTKHHQDVATSKEMMNKAKEFKNAGGEQGVKNAEKWSNNVKKFNEEGGDAKLAQIANKKQAQKDFMEHGGEPAWTNAKAKNDAVGRFEAAGGEKKYKEYKAAETKLNETTNKIKQLQKENEMNAATMSLTQKDHDFFTQNGGDAKFEELFNTHPLTKEQQDLFSQLANARRGAMNYETALKNSQNYDNAIAQLKTEQKAAQDIVNSDGYKQMKSNVAAMGGEQYATNSSLRKGLENDYNKLNNEKTAAGAKIYDKDGNEVPNSKLDQYQASLNDAKNGRGDFEGYSTDKAEKEYNRRKQLEDDLKADGGSTDYADRKTAYENIVKDKTPVDIAISEDIEDTFIGVGGLVKDEGKTIVTESGKNTTTEWGKQYDKEDPSEDHKYFTGDDLKAGMATTFKGDTNDSGKSAALNPNSDDPDDPNFHGFDKYV